MSSEIAIRVNDVSKCFNTYDRPQDRLKQSLFGLAARLSPTGGLKDYFRKRYHACSKNFWALDNVSFEVKKGETVGIIGKNGSGKSTLLQIICGTLSQTHGDVEINGRVAALLELGSGFNPDYSGRENVYLNGQLLGLTRDQINERFNSITEFAEIGEFIDQPVKAYSSGMYVRLAFAVAVNVDADILIVDEALAVGDIAFQAKCMSKLRGLMESGATVLFVSHDMGSVKNLCQRTLWLSHGKALDFGSSERVVGKYIADTNLAINGALKNKDASYSRAKATDEELEDVTAAKSNRTGSTVDFAPGHRRYGDGRAKILDVQLLNGLREPCETLALSEDFVIRATIESAMRFDNLVIGYSFRDLKGNQLLGSVSTNFPDFRMPIIEKGEIYEFEIKGKNVLSQGVYTLSIGLEECLDPNRSHVFVDILENVRVFRSSFAADPHAIFPALVWQPVEYSAGRTLTS